MFTFRWIGLVLLFGLGLPFWGTPYGQGQGLKEPLGKQGWAEIQVVDEGTGKGIPLVELTTVNSLVFVTDNSGRVALQEPELMGQEVYFSIQSHGYDLAKDGFGFKGARVTPKVGQVAIIKLKRINIAERLCRLTGEGLNRDSQLLGYFPPKELSVLSGMVVGQDSVQAALFQKRVHWFWGDTNRLRYPLGLYRMAGATTPLPKEGQPAFDPSGGIPFEYFVDKTGFARAMMPLPQRPEGVVWVFSLCVVPDAMGTETLVAHYTRRKSLAEEVEKGIAVFDPTKSIFESVKVLPLTESWRHPSGHPIPYEEKGKQWLLLGSPNPNVRVPATLEAILDPTQYEAFTCAEKSPNNNLETPRLDGNKKPVWRWQKELPPIDSKTEQKWVKEGKINPLDSRFYPANVNNVKERVVLHNGSVRWNEYRKKWILLAGQLGGKSSLLGEVWYAEADAPTGPFSKAIKVVTHDKQTYYNVCHHAFLDRDGGRVIHFEGTYTNDFSGNPWKTPRYNYNQVLYRLDLGNKILQGSNPPDR